MSVSAKYIQILAAKRRLLRVIAARRRIASQRIAEAVYGAFWLDSPDARLVPVRVDSGRQRRSTPKS